MFERWSPCVHRAGEMQRASEKTGNWEEIPVSHRRGRAVGEEGQDGEQRWEGAYVSLF